MPWLLRRLIDEQNIEYFQLSLTQGFWRSNLWGSQPLKAEVQSGTFLLLKYGPHNQRFLMF